MYSDFQSSRLPRDLKHKLPKSFSSIKQPMKSKALTRHFCNLTTQQLFAVKESGFKNRIRLVSVDAKTCPDRFFASIKIYNFFFADEKKLVFEIKSTFSKKFWFLVSALMQSLITFLKPGKKWTTLISLKKLYFGKKWSKIWALLLCICHGKL